jgi:hypothetical protein
MIRLCSNWASYKGIMRLNVTMYGALRHFSDQFESMETFDKVLALMNQTLDSSAPTLRVVGPVADQAYIYWTKPTGKIIKGRSPAGKIVFG